MLNFPPKVKVEEINQMHPWRAGLGPVWENARLLHDGGHRLSNSAGNFIIRRFMEPETIYRERLKHFTSEGILGTSVSFYSEALFEDPLKVALDIENENEKTIFSQLLERAWRDQRRRGSSIQDLALQIPADWLVFCLSWTLIERPPLTAASRSQELNNPSLWPYAVLLEPEDVINWSVGEDDQLDWVVIHSVETEQETPFSKPEKVIRWRVYDRKFAAVYRKSEDNDKKDIAVLEGEPVPHALHDAELVPVVRSEVPKSLWIADRALLSLESGIRASSAVDWAIEQSALAIPVISNDTEVNLTKSETAWIQLEANGSAGYLESSGKGIEAGQENVRINRESALREMHLSMISRDSMAMPSQQSGVSKAFDFKASTQVMQALGVRTRRNIRTTAEYLALSLGLKGEVTVAGMDFSEPKDMPELHQWRAAEEMGLTRDSPTYAKDIKKEHVRRQSDDSAPEKLKIIFSEIDNAADPVEVREEVLAG